MWREALDDFWWADTYGWPPTVVEEQPAVRLARLRVVTIAINEGRAKRANDEAKGAANAPGR